MLLVQLLSKGTNVNSGTADGWTATEKRAGEMWFSCRWNIRNQWRRSECSVLACVLFRCQAAINGLPVSLGHAECQSLANIKASLALRELGLDLRSSRLIIPEGTASARLFVFRSERRRQSCFRGLTCRRHGHIEEEHFCLRGRQLVSNARVLHRVSALGFLSRPAPLSNVLCFFLFSSNAQFSFLICLSGDRVIDVGSEWRTFSNEKALKDPSRVGDAQNPLLNGGDLTTMISKVQ